MREIDAETAAVGDGIADIETEMKFKRAAQNEAVAFVESADRARGSDFPTA